MGQRGAHIWRGGSPVKMAGQKFRAIKLSQKRISEPAPARLGGLRDEARASMRSGRPESHGYCRGANHIDLDGRHGRTARCPVSLIAYLNADNGPQPTTSPIVAQALQTIAVPPRTERRRGGRGSAPTPFALSLSKGCSFLLRHQRGGTALRQAQGERSRTGKLCKGPAKAGAQGPAPSSASRALSSAAP